MELQINDDQFITPIILQVTNNTNNGQLVDLFRKKVFDGIEIGCPYQQSVVEGGISYEEFVDAFKHSKYVIGMTRIIHSITIPEIEIERRKIGVLCWDVTGVSMMTPIDYPDVSKQDQKTTVDLFQEYMTDNTTFIRIWSPANSATTISLFPKKQKVKNSL